jgi:hypothetical protein
MFAETDDGLGHTTLREFLEEERQKGNHEDDPVFSAAQN